MKTKSSDNTYFPRQPNRRASLEDIRKSFLFYRFYVNDLEVIGFDLSTIINYVSTLCFASLCCLLSLIRHRTMVDGFSHFTLFRPDTENAGN